MTFSAESATALVGSSATTEAERRSPLNSASSPKTLPRPTRASVIRRPSGKRRTILTAPVWIT
jgi:hypothetical protein